MCRMAYGYSVVLILVAAVSFAAYSLSQENEPLQLLTDDDARELDHTDEEWNTVQAAAPPAPGSPAIVFEEPDVKLTAKGPEILAVTPTNFYIIFRQQGSPLDMSTLNVWGEKFFLKKNITQRVLKYIKKTSEGAVLHARDVHVPKGKYKVGISIADTDGNKVSNTYLLRVN